MPIFIELGAGSYELGAQPSERGSRECPSLIRLSLWPASHELPSGERPDLSSKLLSPSSLSHRPAISTANFSGGRVASRQMTSAPSWCRNQVCCRLAYCRVLSEI